MLRITTRNAGGQVVLKLEGYLWGAWVEELDACWRAANMTERRSISIDLSDVYSVDEAGRQLLSSMYQAGAAFVTKGCVMPELLREISESSTDRVEEWRDLCSSGNRLNGEEAKKE